MSYQNTFSPLKVGQIELANRIIMGSMHTGLEDKLKDLPTLTRYFEERSKGQVGLIVTGGYSPNLWGRLTPFAGTFSSAKIARAHQDLTKAVHGAGPSKIVLQLLHAGRYSYHPLSMAPSRKKSPITPFTPFAMPGWMVKKTIKDFIQSAQLAKEAGYDGVEIMGSEGYLIHQFFAQKTNLRTDEWGGSLENRMRFATEIVKGIRRQVGLDFLIVFRIPILDLLPDGESWESILNYAKTLQHAGVSILNSGIGWHESRVPTIASMVPEAAFVGVTKMLKQSLAIPVAATNRFSQPDSIEKAISQGHADLVTMARPFLADSHFVVKMKNETADQINPCIACNQACLDHIFQQKRASCLVNPTACEEQKWDHLNHSDKRIGSDKASTVSKTDSKKIAVFGAGVAGLNAALVMLKSGHQVSIFERSQQVGGQFLLAAQIPGKQDYLRSIQHWAKEVIRLGGKIIYDFKSTDDQILELAKDYDEFVVATGVKPRVPHITGQEQDHVFFYDQYLSKTMKPGKNVVIIGAGGIGVDVANYIINHRHRENFSVQDFFDHWNIDPLSLGGLKNQKSGASSPRQTELNVTVLQRSAGSWGKGLGKTTGWIHKAELKKAGVKILTDLTYDRITSSEVVIKFNSGEVRSIPADQVVICAGQESEDGLRSVLEKTGKKYVVIGGAKMAGELDAKRAIRDAYSISQPTTLPASK